MLLQAGCTYHHWSREVLVKWSTDWVHEPKSLWYHGSDKNYHYFSGRPIDHTVFIKVDRSEMTLIDERPRTSATTYEPYYPMDPADGFTSKLDSRYPPEQK